WQSLTEGFQQDRLPSHQRLRLLRQCYANAIDYWINLRAQLVRSHDCIQLSQARAFLRFHRVSVAFTRSTLQRFNDPRFTIPAFPDLAPCSSLRALPSLILPAAFPFRPDRWG